MLCAGESQIVFLPHHRCVSACCSLTRESLFIPTDSSSTSAGVEYVYGHEDLSLGQEEVRLNVSPFRAGLYIAPHSL